MLSPNLQQRDPPSGFILPLDHPFVQQRLNICSQCPHMKIDHGILGAVLGAVGVSTPRCDICHCFLKAKARLPMFHCPLRYW
jgi:hypothetical protein